jgi:hypothetical protein
MYNISAIYYPRERSIQRQTTLWPHPSRLSTGNLEFDSRFLHKGTDCLSKSYMINDLKET